MKCSVFEKTHASSADSIKSYLKGKTVYDIGAGDGSFALMMAVYADEVVAVEMEGIYADMCRDRGLKTICDDFENIKPDCDVVYAFLSFVGNYKLTRWLKKNRFKGTVISHYYPLHEVIDSPWRPSEVIHDDLPFLIYKVNFSL